MSRVIRQLNLRSNEKPLPSKRMCYKVWRFLRYRPMHRNTSCQVVGQRFRLSAAEVQSLVYDERFSTFGPIGSDRGELVGKRAHYFLRANSIGAIPMDCTLRRRRRDRKRAKRVLGARNA